ncbi:hypothetical protein HK096_001880, partial [Nowakowskiella sp. JEL0078]
MYVPADKQGMLVWGGASSVGSMAVQAAKLFGFTVYATASEKHHNYLKSLGASKVFDYKDKHVVESIVKAAKEDGVRVQFGYLAAGQLQLQPCLEILKELKGEGSANLVSAPSLPEELPSVKGVKAIWASMLLDETWRKEHFHFIFGIWLKEKLEKKELMPSPKIQKVDGGLGAAQKALDQLKNGVSGVKLVLE